MPPKKGLRKSISARANTDASLSTPSRRSARVPAAEKTINSSSRSSKSLDRPPSTTPDNSFNIHFYNPKTPSTNGHSRNASPDVSLARRSTFQARPSRLSSVYTPAVETPNSSQSSRRTRRMAALESPQTSFSDHEMTGTLGSTGWTYDQYTGGLGFDGPKDRRPTPSVSSMGTRVSTRIRKPTAKALEAIQSKSKPRRPHKETPGPVEDWARTSSAPSAAPVAGPAPSSNRTAKISFRNVSRTTPKIAPKTSPNSTSKTGFRSGPKSTPRSAPTPTIQKGTRSCKKGKKGNSSLKSTLHRVQITVGRAGQKLFELATVALSTDFVAPSDPQQFIKDARTAHRQREMDEIRGVTQSDEASATDAGSVSKPANPEFRIIRTFKKSSSPNVSEDKWTYTGRTNKSGEEVVLTPPGYSLDRAPHAYGDEALPYPPVRSRSDEQAATNDAFGYPPLLGDRNIPFDPQSHFEPEDVTEERAQAQARKKKAIAPTEPIRKGGRKRRQPEADIADKPVSPSDPAALRDGERDQKRRRGQTVSTPANTKQAPRKTPASRSAKAKPETKPETKMPPLPPAMEDAPSTTVQRLRLTVKPPTAAEMQECNLSRNVIPARPATSQGRQQAVGPTAGVTSTKKPSVNKGKKRAADLISNDEVNGDSKSPAGRGRGAADIEVDTAALSTPSGRSRAEKSAPKDTRGRGHDRGGSRGRGATRGKPTTGGGKRARGRGV
ncbi:uncharacterized protein N7482_001057 [Penicillium canariense]|uniref:Uncharacterized protein n=1 Tax=Penicillium canariense TaxID=189055 RepID=A0A9W9IFV0_9EURO|nr:uncharacterized protein N7482_001057 [Penicillium canariense]KAJ5175180.1 hypothetical protein N7482_001057 [Penicillium canariense]